MAVPLRLAQGETSLAMNCTLAAYRVQKDSLVREVVPLLKDAARQLEAAQGLR